MCGQHAQAKETLEGILDRDFSNSMKQSILVDLALSHNSLGEKADARAVAKQIIEIDPHSNSALHAEALLIELAEDDPLRMEKLEALELRARRENATTVAGNIALFRANRSGADPDKVKKILAPIVNSKSASDHYNRTRAAVKLAETSLNIGNLLTEAELSQLVQAYHFVFNEQMPRLFDRCHDALWRDFTNRGDFANLLILFRHSSLRWRLRGQDQKEEEYLEKLGVSVSNAISESLNKVEKEVAYYLVRQTYYARDA
jgi:alkylhydroperoxidase family enzyme